MIILSSIFINHFISSSTSSSLSTIINHLIFHYYISSTISPSHYLTSLSASPFVTSGWEVGSKDEMRSKKNMRCWLRIEIENWLIISYFIIWDLIMRSINMRSKNEILVDHISYFIFLPSISRSPDPFLSKLLNTSLTNHFLSFTIWPYKIKW